jgi:hypothetical protein
MQSMAGHKLMRVFVLVVLDLKYTRKGIACIISDVLLWAGFCTFNVQLLTQENVQTAQFCRVKRYDSDRRVVRF